MGRYMTVVLKEKHKNDFFIHLLNEELARQYGANTGIKFSTWAYLQEETDYINYHPEGLKQLTHWQRPVTKEQLYKSFFWYRVGEFSFKLSGSDSSDQARDAVAVCKWLVRTKCNYIEKTASNNYDQSTVSEYLNYLFEEAGYDLIALWKIPES